MSNESDPMPCNRLVALASDHVDGVLDADFLFEGLAHEMELRQKIILLQEYRNNGLEHLFRFADLV